MLHEDIRVVVKGCRDVGCRVQKGQRNDIVPLAEDMVRISSKLIPAYDFNVDCKAQYEENKEQQRGQPVTIKIKDRFQEKRHIVNSVPR